MASLRLRRQGRHRCLCCSSRTSRSQRYSRTSRRHCYSRTSRRHCYSLRPWTAVACSGHCPRVGTCHRTRASGRLAMRCVMTTMKCDHTRNRST
eukprot:365374-Chlamydomonas_euryale.AAC.4